MSFSNLNSDTESNSSESDVSVLYDHLIKQ